MIYILISISFIFDLILIIYLLGLIPNLWSREFINYNNFYDVIHRGGKIILNTIAIAFILFVLYLLGEVIISIISIINIFNNY